MLEARRVSLWRSRYELIADGRPIATWDGRVWRSEEQLVSDGRPVGSVRRVSLWRGDVAADLPDLPLPLQVFVVVVVLTMWNAQAAAASGA